MRARIGRKQLNYEIYIWNGKHILNRSVHFQNCTKISEGIKMSC